MDREKTLNTNTESIKMLKKTRTQIKYEAQKELMYALQTAFASYSEVGNFADDDFDQRVYDEMEKQFERVEGCLGMVKGSWGKGC